MKIENQTMKRSSRACMWLIGIAGSEVVFAWLREYLEQITDLAFKRDEPVRKKGSRQADGLIIRRFRRKGSLPKRNIHAVLPLACISHGMALPASLQR